ncbi:alpha/beta fold hydrolase [Psychromicrobium lacuslunae]|uniref:Esterase n=1 Tax=Psychromicrobium lacuslunae TaxID=1618207 RepID=A0A0D4C207_9MICC|nr:alpha/beta hydrolase [Psychromicrobium lacuslunae]AJT42707.1 esterase [Psychromicrobium lacuslunae]
MDIILVPGFWLQGSSWDNTTPALIDAGHTVHPVTPPGLESIEAKRAGIGLRDHVDAVLRLLDSLPAGAVLVGHSGGGAVIHAVADARPEKVIRGIYVDSGPLGAGGSINDELPVVNGEIPLPDWSVFEEPDLRDLNDELKAHFRQVSIPEPVGVAQDKQVLHDERRYQVPSSVICCEFSAADAQRWMDGGEPMMAELAKMTDLELLDLPTGHWPQLTRPKELGELLLQLVERR